MTGAELRSYGGTYASRSPCRFQPPELLAEYACSVRCLPNMALDRGCLDWRRPNHSAWRTGLRPSIALGLSTVQHSWAEGGLSLPSLYYPQSDRRWICERESLRCRT